MTPAETVDDEPSSPLEGMVMEPEIEIQTSSEVLNISIDDSATTPLVFVNIPVSGTWDYPAFSL